MSIVRTQGFISSGSESLLFLDSIDRGEGPRWASSLLLLGKKKWNLGRCGIVDHAPVEGLRAANAEILLFSERNRPSKRRVAFFDSTI